MRRGMAAGGSYVAKGSPAEVLPLLWQRWGVNKLTFEVDSEPYAKERDAKLTKLASGTGIVVDTHHSHTLHELDRYLFKTKGAVPGTYKSFLKTFGQLGQVPGPAADVAASDVPGPAGGAKPAAEFAVPTLAEMGYPEIAAPAKVLYQGGETAALARMRQKLADHKWVQQFEKPKTAPNALEPATTVLSPYLKFGCLSARVLYHELAAIYKEANGKHAQPPVSLHGQLLWREFFYLNGHAVPNFGRMRGNPICRQIPWDTDAEKLAAWKEARTGFPFIDAIMTQLRQEGWIHHLARHAVACFLTRGDLWQSWEQGARVFELLLLDADWSINSGNWMWLSCSAFFHQFFRCYGPVSFGKKTDPDGLYIKKYLPQLEKFPKKYIYEPWTAPKALQEHAGCIIGKDYPAPMLDHTTVSKANMTRMKAAFDANKAAKAGNPKGAKRAKTS